MIFIDSGQNKRLIYALSVVLYRSLVSMNLKGWPIKIAA